jgi:hypothetical protein
LDRSYGIVDKNRRRRKNKKKRLGGRTRRKSWGRYSTCLFMSKTSWLMERLVSEDLPLEQQH